MKTMIQKMRADWVMVAEERRACGEWSEADEAEIGEAVKRAIESGEADMISCWARWLGDLSATTVALKTIALNINTRIRDQVHKQREADARKKAAPV